MFERRALVLASRFPYPPLSGGKLTLLNFAAALKGYRLTLLSLCSSRAEMELEVDSEIFDEIHRIYLPRIRSYLSTAQALFGKRPLQLAYYESTKFREKLEELLPRNDLVIAHLIRCAQFLEGAKVLEDGNADPARFLLMSDAISMAYSRIMEESGAPRLWRFLYRLEKDRLSNYERECVPDFDQVWLHSDLDRRFLDLKSDNVRIVPVGVDLQEFAYVPNRSGNVIGFIGNMSFSLNLDAVRHFAREIFPVLRDQFGMKLRIIGACPDGVKQEFSRLRGVEVTGAVDRISDAVHDVFCGVCPIRGGAGIQNKILNYFALGIPCVSSEVGATGIDGTPGEHFLVYQSTTQAIDQITRLFQDDLLRKKIAEHGRRIAVEKYDWKEIQRCLFNQVEAVLKERHAPVMQRSCD